MGNTSFDPNAPDDTFTSLAQQAALAAQIAQAAAEQALADTLAALGLQTIDDHFDVTAPAPVTGDNLQWDGVAWINVPNTLDNLIDINAAAPNAGDVLFFNGADYDVTDPVSAGLLPIVGATLTGVLTLDADPLTPLSAATKQYVDSVANGTYDISAYFDGVPGNSEDILRFVAVRNFFIKIATAGDSVAISRVAAVAETIFVVQKNGAPIGDITFAISSTTGVIDITAATNFVSGDSLAIIGPASADVGIEDVQFTIEGILGTT